MFYLAFILAFPFYCLRNLDEHQRIKEPSRDSASPIILITFLFSFILLQRMLLAKR